MFGICLRCNTTYQGDATTHVCTPMFQIVSQQYEALNNEIATEPFKTDAVQKAGVTNGFATAKQKVELAPLKVVYGTEKIPAGSTVYVRGDLCAEAVAKKIYEVEGKKVIFIPVAEVKVVKRWEQETSPAQPQAFAFNKEK